LGLRFGRLRQYATVGFLSLEASRLAEGNQQYYQTIALGGGSLQSRLQAEQGWQQTITGVPFVGGIAGLAADYLGASRTGTALTLRGAELTDEKTRMIVDSRQRLRDAQAQAGIAEAPTQFARERAQAEFERARTGREIQERRTARGALTEQTVGQRSAELERTFETRFQQRANDPLNTTAADLAGGGTGAAIQRRRFARIEGELKGADSGELATLRASLSNDAPFKAEGEAADRLLRARLSTAARSETAYGIRSEASISANLSAAQNDRFASTLTSLTGERNAGVAEAQGFTEKYRALRLGQSRITAFLADTARENAESTIATQVSTAQNRALLTGNTLAAQRLGITAQRDAALRALPNNFLFNNFFGGAERRAGINQQAQSEIELATEQDRLQNLAITGGLRNQTGVSALLADRKPIEASAYGLVSNARLQASLQKGPNASLNRFLILQNTANQAKILENEIVYGGAAEVIASGYGGSRAARNEQAFYHPADDTTSITKAIQTLNADVNNSVFGINKAGSTAY
jgi:3-methyladenine DNA glycosylase Mpg